MVCVYIWNTYVLLVFACGFCVFVCRYICVFKFVICEYVVQLHTIYVQCVQCGQMCIACD